MDKLKKYDPTNKKKIESREKVLENAEILSAIRNKIIEVFKDGTFFTPEEAVYKHETKDNEDNKQLDTTDTPGLEIEEAAEQRKSKKGQELKILTQNKCLVDYQFL